MNGVGDKCPHSLQRVVESHIKYPILPIVHHLRSSGHQVDTRSPKRSMARAERCPIYIHIKTKTFIYIGVLVCLYLGTFTYLFTLIILYFWYIPSALHRSKRVLYAYAGVHMTGRYTLNGGHSCQNLPEKGTSHAKHRRLGDKCPQHRRQQARTTVINFFAVLCKMRDPKTKKRIPQAIDPCSDSGSAQTTKCHDTLHDYVQALQNLPRKRAKS
jgi:hypothetical protein